MCKSVFFTKKTQKVDTFCARERYKFMGNALLGPFIIYVVIFLIPSDLPGYARLILQLGMFFSAVFSGSCFLRAYFLPRA